MSTIALPRTTLEQRAASRKMELADVVSERAVEADGPVLHFTLDELETVSDRLCVPVAKLIAEAEETDLDDGIRVAKAGEGYRRTADRGGRPYYTYEHLVTTREDPDLMPLRVQLHCQDERHTVLNDGHESREMVYVTHGRVRMVWRGGDAERTTTLDPGDSAYIKPGVPHSFSALEDGAELIAVNY